MGLAPYLLLHSWQLVFLFGDMAVLQMLGRELFKNHSFRQMQLSHNLVLHHPTQFAHGPHILHDEQLPFRGKVHERYNQRLLVLLSSFEAAIPAMYRGISSVLFSFEYM